MDYPETLVWAAYIGAEVGLSMDEEFRRAVGEEQDEGNRQEGGRTLLEEVLAV